MEKYLSGELGEAETRELEEHYFACDDCFEALKDATALREALDEQRRTVPVRQVRFQWPWRWVWIGTAAVIVIGIGVAILSLTGNGTDGDAVVIARLAEVDAPPYTPKTLRSPPGEAERRFREAMESYTEGDYAAAIPGLEAAARLDPESAKNAFYLGAALLLTDQPAPAIESLSRVVELGETPFLERARLYRAKAFLRTGDVEAAEKELQEVTRTGGELEAEARRILEQLPR